MENKVIRLLASSKATWALLAVYVLLMAVATIVEKFHGTPVAKALFYYSPLFVLLHVLMVVNFVLLTIRLKLYSRHKLSYLAIHISFIIILTGAMVTHLMGSEGMLHIREGEKTNVILVKEGNGQRIEQLPFEVELVDFRLVRYPGSQSPSSYESYLRLHIDGQVRQEKVYMNNVLDLDGYRFFQASYDEDELGTILSVNRDVAGRTITYTGYSILFIGLFLTLVDRHSRLRRLWRQLDGRVALFVAFMGVAASAVAQDLVISPQHAARLGRLPMQTSSGRVVPVNTFAGEIVRKFKAQQLVGHLSPEQFLLSVMAFPSDWSVIPLIEVNDPGLAALFHNTTGRISYRDAFTDKGQYRLASLVEEVYHKNPAERNRHDKEILKVDDRINIFHELLNNRLLRIFPNANDTLRQRWIAAGEVAPSDSALAPMVRLSAHYISSVRHAGIYGGWLAPDSILTRIVEYQTAHQTGPLIHRSRLQAEVYYNELNLPRLCRMGYLILGACMLVFYFVAPSRLERSASRILRLSLLAGVVFFFGLHTLCLALRWYISGYAPWSNSYEIMLSLAWAGVMCGFIFVRKNGVVSALATLFGGVLLFVSGLSWMDPQITPLVPVLKSPWLMAHVATLVISYGFLGISCTIGTAWQVASAFVRDRRFLQQLILINELSMILGVCFMAVGIFLGAIWANESWGRYWSWDPKETWALISMVVYSLVLHYRWMAVRKNDFLFSFLSQWSILSILMTFLGVNYFLSGMHSYGSHDALSSIPVVVYVAVAVFFLLPLMLSLVGRRSSAR